MSRAVAAFVAVIGVLQLWCGAAAETPFVPVPDDQKPLYRFALDRWFYKDEAARKKDLSELRDLKQRIAALEPAAVEDPAKLLEVIELGQKMGIISDRLQNYGYLRYFVNTNDTAAKDEGDDAWNDFCETTASMKIAAQRLDDSAIKRFLDQNSGLARYRLLLQTWRRNQSHTAADAAESVLARLASRLDPFSDQYYNMILARTPDATLTVDRAELNVTNPADYDRLLRLDDRSLREQAYRKRLAAFKGQADLYSFALLEKVRTANAIASIHKFRDAAEATLFESYMSPDTLDAILKAFRDHAGLSVRFQAAEKAYQARLLHIREAEPWDLDARPPGVPEPRFSIGDASKAVIEATKVFGTEYRSELRDCLDPCNGRLDIVPGNDRARADCTAWAYGATSVIYLQEYGGYQGDVTMLAHESGHAVHVGLFTKAGVPWYYGYGAPYVTEGVAILNELLTLDKLASDARSQSNRLLVLRELARRLAVHFYHAAYATEFETEVYRRVAKGTVTRPEDIHKVYAEIAGPFVPDFVTFPDLQYYWAATHHFIDVPRYFSNYLFADILAVAMYERLRADAAFGNRIVDFMKAGWSDEPAVLMRTHLGIDLRDPKTLNRVFSLIEKRVTEFEREVRSTTPSLGVSQRQ